MPSFEEYLTDRNLGSNDFPLRLRGVVQRLKHHPNKVPPNSPLLDLLADHLKAPLDEIQAFAQGARMPDKWVKKINTQIQRDSIPRGGPKSRWRVRGQIKRRAAKKEHTPIPAGHVTTPFAKLAAEKGYTLKQLAERLGAKPAFMWNVSCGNMAKNHPVLEALAKILDVEVKHLSRLMKKPAFNEGFYRRAQKDLLANLEAARDESSGKGKSVVLASTEVRSNGHRPAVVVHEQRAYNRLGSKRSSIKLRQSVRDMIATLNIAVMRGDSHMPAIPVEDLYVLLQDYVQEKGIKTVVLIDPLFTNTFDPKG